MPLWGRQYVSKCEIVNEVTVNSAKARLNVTKQFKNSRSLLFINLN